MALGYIGDDTFADKATSSASAAVTTTRTLAVGTLVIATCYNLNTTATQTYSASDTKTNTWTLFYDGTVTVGATVLSYASVLTTALVANTDSVTLSWTTATKGRVMAIESFSGYTGTSTRDQRSIASGSVFASPSISITPSGSQESLLFAAEGLTGPTTDSFTQDTTNGWSTPTGSGAGTTGGAATSNVTLRMAYKIETGGGLQTWSPASTARDGHIYIVNWLQPVAQAPASDILVASQAIGRAALR